MTTLAIASKAASPILKHIAAMMDPKLRKALDREIQTFVLSELPRIHRLLEDRIDEVSASGCSPVEAHIIAHQVVEAQKRTLDADKRRRLSNVLVNGLCTPEWDKARHRLMVRLTEELEEEHIDRLRREVRTAAEHETESERIRLETATAESREEFERKHIALQPVRIGIARELVARGLLDEHAQQIQNPSWMPPKPPEYDPRTGKAKWDRPDLRGVKRVPEFLDRTSLRISDLGRMLLEHLRDPEGPKPTQRKRGVRGLR